MTDLLLATLKLVVSRREEEGILVEYEEGSLIVVRRTTL